MLTTQDPESARMLAALARLAADFRAAAAPRRPALVAAYNAQLEALLDYTAWDDDWDGEWLGPAACLPRELLLPRYTGLPPGAPDPQGEPLLRGRLRRHDLLLLTVQARDGQHCRGRVERAYSRRFELPGRPYDGPSIPFVGAPGGWGTRPLAQGERALVFLGQQGGQYHQCFWLGHYTLEALAGGPHAVANGPLPTGPAAGWPPAYLCRAAFRVGEAAPPRTAMPFDLFERHVLEELARLA